MTIKKYTEEELEQLEDRTNYERLDKMSQEEVESNSLSDEDCITPSENDLKKFKKVKNND
jgi:hypothetical protein